MSLWDRITGKQALAEAREQIEELRVDRAISASNVDLFKERLAELEFSLEDEGWQLLGGMAQQEFSRNGLRIINGLARLYFLKNPLIKRAVLTQTQYVFGQGVNIHAKQPLVNDVIQAFWDDRKNKAELTEHQALQVKETELQCFGNLFFVFFTNRFNGHVRVRTIPMDQIMEIVTNPDDAKEPWYYKRVWQQEGFNVTTGQYITKLQTAYYPDWRYKPKIKGIGNIPIEIETPVYHVAVNRLSDQKFGVSEIYAGLDWARAYKEFLENLATIHKALARFAWKISLSKGGTTGVAAVKAQLESTLGTGTETNPPPTTGSTAVITDSVKLEAVRTRGAATKADDGRYLRLMVSSATGIFEHYLTGDPSTGNLATAKAMELPMLIMFRDRQQLWTSILSEIFDFVIEQAVRAGVIQGKVEKDDYGEEVVVLANDTENDNPDLRDKPIDDHVDIDFPNILEQDIETRVNAVVSAATLDGKPLAGTMTLEFTSRLVLEALGLDNVDEIINELFPEGEGEEPPPTTEEAIVSEVRQLFQKLEKELL